MTKICSLIILFIFIISPINTSFGQEQNITSSILFSQTGISPGKEARMAVVIEVKPGFHIYAYNEANSLPTVIKIEPCAGLIFGDPSYPEGINKSLMGLQSLIYEGKVTVYIPVKAKIDATPGDCKITATVSYQACDDESCYLPQDAQVHAVWKIVDAQTHPELTNQTVFSQKREIEEKHGKARDTGKGEEDRVGEDIEGNLWTSLLFAFIGGILTSLTPCVYPMIPITIGFFVKQSEKKSRAHILLLSIIFALGIVCLYTIIGGIVLYSKNLFGYQLSFNFLLQTPVVCWSLVVVFFALGLSMFGLYEFRLPSFVTSRVQVGSGGTIGAFLRGFFLGIIAAPCMGPALVAILTFALTTLQPLKGILLLAIYASGVGVLFIVLALFSGSLPRGGDWMHGVEVFMGVLIFILGLYFLWMVVSITVLAIVTGVFLLLFTVYLLWEPIKERQKNITSFIFAGLCLVAGLFFTLGFLFKIEGEPAPTRVLEKALYPGDWVKDYDKGMMVAMNEKRPVLVDVWAKWCVPCILMDHTTFQDPRIKDALKTFVTIKMDVTTLSPEKKGFMDQHKLLGPPSIVIFESSGNLFKVYRSKVDADTLLGTLQECLKK